MHHPADHHGIDLEDDCSSESELSDDSDSASDVFLKVLKEPYEPPARALGSEQSRSEAGLPNAEDEDEAHGSRDEGQNEVDDCGDTPQESEDDDRQAYRPHGHWAWTAGMHIEGSKVLMHLGTGTKCSVYLMKGIIDKQEITYISKLCHTEEMALWNASQRELALYDSDEYLRPLQGHCVPFIISAYALPGGVSVIMEPPHPSFWIEASPTMPVVLKRRCVEAFEKLHARGILHGDPELRHMLIGADAKVTLIDFHDGKALIPDPDVSLESARKEDLELEMRKVKFKLDYGSAREDEKKKMVRGHWRSEGITRSRGHSASGDVEDDPTPAEDKTDPPVDSGIFMDKWEEGMNAVPRRFVVPGRRRDEVDQDIRRFLAIVRLMEAEEVAAYAASARRGAHVMRSVNSIMAESSGIDLSSGNQSTVSRTPVLQSSLPAAPIVSCLVPPRLCQPVMIPRDAPSYRPLMDLIEHYNGIRTARLIVHRNALTCFEQGLPHPMVLSAQGKALSDDPIQLTRPMGANPLVGIGSLKRAREDLMNPDAARLESIKKRVRYETLRQRREPVIRKRKRAAEDEGDDEYLTDEYPALDEGPKILSWGEFSDSQAAVAVPRSHNVIIPSPGPTDVGPSSLLSVPPSRIASGPANYAAPIPNAGSFVRPTASPPTFPNRPIRDGPPRKHRMAAYTDIVIRQHEQSLAVIGIKYGRLEEPSYGTMTAWPETLPSTSLNTTTKTGGTHLPLILETLPPPSKRRRLGWLSSLFSWRK